MILRLKIWWYGVKMIRPSWDNGDRWCQILGTEVPRYFRFYNRPWVFRPTSHVSYKENDGRIYSSMFYENTGVRV